MFADALATLGASASADIVLTPKSRIFCLQHQERYAPVTQTPRVYHCNQILFGRESDQNLKTTKQLPS